MKANKSALPLLLTLAVIYSCSPRTFSNKQKVADELPDGGHYTEKTVPVVTKVAPDKTVTLRFYDSTPDVAYISAADFQAIVLPESVMTVTHTGVGEYTLANGDYKAVVNVNKDSFVSSQFEDFTNQMSLLQADMPNVYYDGMPFVRFKSVELTPSVSTVTFDFARYGIDLHADGKGTVYFPFATLADMYTDLYYHHAGFNGEKVVANTTLNEISLSAIDPDYFKPIMEKRTRSESLADFTYRELCFAMDHFYGFPGRIKYNDALKAKGLDKTLDEDVPCGASIKKLLHSTNLAEYFFGMTGLTGLYYDGHTAMEIMSSAIGEDMEAYSDIIDDYRNLQTEHMDIYQLLMEGLTPAMSMMQDNRAVHVIRPEEYGTNDTYLKKGNTAICVFNSFNNRNEKAWNDYYTGVGPLPTKENTENDDLVVFLDALQKAAADPEVKNFIIDLTGNGGGSVDVVMAMTSLIMNKSYLCHENSLTGQRAIVNYEVDRNFDGVFDELDQFVHYDLNFGVLTSDVSFSCGNLFPSLFKDAGLPVIGETSGGGSCAIQAMCTADGFCFQISSFRAGLCMLDGTNIDPGVKPDYPIEPDGTINIKLSEEWSQDVKNYKPFYDFDRLAAIMAKAYDR